MIICSIYRRVSFKFNYSEFKNLTFYWTLLNLSFMKNIKLITKKRIKVLQTKYYKHILWSRLFISVSFALIPIITFNLLCRPIKNIRPMTTIFVLVKKSLIIIRHWSAGKILNNRESGIKFTDCRDPKSTSKLREDSRDGIEGRSGDRTETKCSV